tara:strand:- start:67 stop:186 length:120 start_codon:yes stop_codon:yes gene_type:complete
MENELRDTGDWANIPFHEKLDHFYCLRCFDGIDMIEEDS